MDNSFPLGLLSDKLYYSAHFMDLSLWQPFLGLVCERHGFGFRQALPGSPGSFPTFIVELDANGVQQSLKLIVIKFFGPLFKGPDSFHIERTMGYWLVQQSLPIRSPTILAEGQLASQWWYLLFEHIPGVSIGQVRQQLSADTWAGVACQMGETIQALHVASANTMPFTGTAVTNWDGYVDFLEEQRSNCYTNHLLWKDLPAHLLDQLQDFIAPVEQLLDLTSPPYIIHADLTSDHLLGRLALTSKTSPKGHQSPLPAGTEWHTLAIIDWGDARLGNILYELVALHLDLFQADKRLLRICLDAYTLPDFYRHDFPHKALSMVLLHQFPMPAHIFASHQEVHTLHELAEQLFGM